MTEQQSREIWAVVPLKSLSHAKQRLAPVLDARARQKLMLAMIRDVLATLQQVPSIAGILLVSRDPQAESLADELGAEWFASPADQDLNSALGAALEDLAARGIPTAMILPGDLPLIQPTDINDVLAVSEGVKELLVVADLEGDGTNCLVLSPPTGIIMQFGPGSFSHHCQAALDAGLKLKNLSPGAAWLDIDEPSDFDRLLVNVKAGHAATETTNFVHQI